MRLLLLCALLATTSSSPTQHQFTTCEHQSVTLTCPPGNNILIVEAMYGRKDRSTCPSGPIQTTNCESSASQQLARSLCNDKTSCTLQASNSVFGDPCVGTYKYLQGAHTCQPQEHHFTTCEHRSVALTCPTGYNVFIVEAMYGRNDRSTCPDGPIQTTNCGSSGSLQLARSRCNYRTSCTLQASNSVFGDPCVGTYKYLQGAYTCQRQEHEFTTCEHQFVTLTCPPGNTIFIVEAMYGRKDRSTCPSEAIQTTNCESSTSRQLARSRCKYRTSCTLKASNSVFGDPCVGTYKYLQGAYTCQPQEHEFTTCEHQSVTLTCPSTHEIFIVEAMYGRKDRSTCPGGPIRTTNCESSASHQSARDRCNGKLSCTLQASNSVFGDPCVGTYKYLQGAYTCQRQEHKEFEEYVCEHNTATLHCTEGTMSIINASYGRSDRTNCPSDAIYSTSCHADNSERIVGDACNGETTCSVSASNGVFGDPCIGTVKYLYVKYICEE